MTEEIITEKRVKEIVQQYLSARIEDVDEIRKSPAGRVLIIETEVKNLNDKIDRLDAKVDTVRNELKSEINNINLELKKEIKDLRSGLQQEIQGSKNLSLALFIAVLGLIGSIFVKVFFFM